MEITILILTPLSLEYDAVVKQLTEERPPLVRGTAAYGLGSFAGKYDTYSVIVRETGMRNTEMALAAKKAIEEFRPQIVLLCGIAGSIKDLKVGDIIVANKASLTSAGKEDIDGDKARPEVYYFSNELLAYAKSICKNNNWKQRTADGAPTATVLFGGIVADDKVIASTASPIYERLRRHYNDSISIDMESAGLGRVLLDYRTVHGLVIRGISDQLFNKSEADAGGSQFLAAERAAAFAFELLYQINCSSFILPNMDPVTIAKEVYALLFPIPESIKEIGRDFAGAANDGIRALWKKVKPLFINEAEKLEKDPENADRQASLRTKLVDELEENEALRKDIIAIVEKVKAQDPAAAAAISIMNSKNVVAGSNITVGGSFRVGDGG